MAHTVTYAYVGWDDAFRTPPPVEGLEYYLRRLPRRWLVTTLGQIGTTLFNSGQHFYNPNQQLAFLYSLKNDVAFAERLARFIASQQNRVLLHPEIVSTLIKYAILYGADTDAVPGYAYDHLIRAIILLNTKYGEAHGIKSGNGDPLIFLDYELESMLATHENEGFAMARYHQFMRWAENQDPAGADYLAVNEDFRQFFGLSYDEYATAAFAVFASFAARSSLDLWRQQRGAVDINAWTATLQEKHHITDLLAMFSIDPEDAKTKLAESTNAYGMRDLRIFVDQPLVRMDEAVFACPYQGFLRNRLGPGLYFALFDQYKNSGKQLQFAQFFGAFLEQYLFNLVADGARHRNDVLVFPEKRYRVAKGESKSSDIVIIAGDTAVFMDHTKAIQAR